MKRVPVLTSLGLSLALSFAALGACSSAKPTAGGPKPADPAKPAELTTADAVIEASIAAQGGRERIGKLTSIRQTGTLALPQMGLKGTLKSVAAPPYQLVRELELAGLGKQVQGISGDVAWEQSTMTGARILTGEEREQTMRDAAFHGDLEWKKLYPKAELGGIVDWQGAPAYKVVLSPAQGEPVTRYFAKDTLLPNGIAMVGVTQMGKIPTEVVVSDWRDIQGIKYPHKMVMKQGPQAIEITLDTIELDPPLDPSTFALPPEVAALQKK